ncbi:hypothetical protein HDE_14552 [Halotydeus destructor]|nr:hypothetical protein HDE_14552 [Halotydeus destructor]
MARVVNGVNLDDINDEQQLEAMLDELSIDQPDLRKLVRIRMKELKDQSRAAMHEKMARIANSGEEAIQKRLKEANEKKARTLEMYDQMAKSAPAGGNKVMDVNIYKTGQASGSLGQPEVKRDMVEETIQDRVRAADDEKRRILAAYDAAAKSSPAGVPKVVDLKNFRKEDAVNFEPAKPSGVATFSSLGGVPVVVKASASQPGSPSSSSSSGPPSLLREEYIDTTELMIRERQREANENKRRILAAYDAAARTGPSGPKMVVISDLPRDEAMAEPRVPAKAALSATTAFSGGVAVVETIKPKSVPRAAPPGALVFGKSSARRN